jgi:hypothetical protein
VLSCTILIRVRLRFVTNLLPRLGSVAGYLKLSPPFSFVSCQGTWATVGTLHNARKLHTMSLLLNGNVLAVGGQGFSGSLVSCELFSQVDVATTVETTTTTTTRSVTTSRSTSGGRTTTTAGRISTTTTTSGAATAPVTTSTPHHASATTPAPTTHDATSTTGQHLTESPGLSASGIAGIVIGSVLGVVILVVLIYIYRRSRQARQYRVVQYRCVTVSWLSFPLLTPSFFRQVFARAGDSFVL